MRRGDYLTGAMEGRDLGPKGKSLAGVTPPELDEVARKLNGRPRLPVGSDTP
jgi:IS30 family transposase